tara:strand:- start:10143 stop:10493 length:351 start_codon:yes stop_codon:yes gene_type:complete
MGTEMTKGKDFASGQTITHTDLNSLVDDAVIEKGAITERTEVTTLEDDDMFLVFDDDANALKKVKRLVVARASPNQPGASSANGTAGDLAYDSSYLYICTATGTPGTWERVGIATW